MAPGAALLPALQPVHAGKMPATVLIQNPAQTKSTAAIPAGVLPDTQFFFWRMPRFTRFRVNAMKRDML